MQETKYEEKACHSAGFEPITTRNALYCCATAMAQGHRKHTLWCLPTKNRFEHFEPKLFKLSFTGIYQNEGLQRKMFGNRKLKNKSYNSIQFNLSESRQHFKL